MSAASWPHTCRPMKITGYMQLKPEHIAYDEQTRTVRLAKAARGWNFDIYPTEELAAAAAYKGSAVYTVEAEVPDHSVFEALGDIDQTEGRLGVYCAGRFADYETAFRAATGLGVQGRRGPVEIKPPATRVYDTAEDWKADFDVQAARKIPRNGERILLSEVVELAPTDETAIGAADPEYALWLRLNQKFGEKYDWASGLRMT